MIEKWASVLHERNFCNFNALNLLSRDPSFPGTCMITDQDFSENITAFVRQEWGLEIYTHPLKKLARLQTDPLAKSVNEIHLTLRNRWGRLFFANLSRDK